MLPLQQFDWPTTVSEFVAQFGDFLWAVASFVVAFVVVYLLARSVLVRLVRGSLSARGFDRTVVQLAGNTAQALALFVAIAVAFTVAGFGSFLAAFATLGGALALALGFAAQDLVANFVAGIFILKDKPFEVGDYIEWDGNGGVVREINLRVSKLDTWDNEQLTVPNGDLAGSVVKNPVANDTRRVTVDFGIDYGADSDLARSIILEEASAIEGVLADPEPSAPLTALGDSAVVLNARVWIDPAETGAGGVKNELIERVKHRFDEAGVGMPYPHRELVGSLSVESPGPDSGVVSDD
jgi:small-conductance mechanosensitive channel